MTTISASLSEELRHDFSRALAELSQARLHHVKKDTAANRAAVAEWLAVIDAILDMHLDTRECAPKDH